MRQGNGSGVGRLWDDVQSMSSIVLKALIQALSLLRSSVCYTGCTRISEGVWLLF